MITQVGPPTHDDRSPVEAVLLDAYGTLVTRDRPVERLTDSLEASGHRHPPARVRTALDVEIRFYRSRLHEARDAASLAALRAECARVLADALGGDAPAPGVLVGMLMDALRMVPFPDAPAALAALALEGIPVAVVSNWDCGLPDVLRDAGLASGVAVVCASAAVGAAKPDPAIFRNALARLGVPPGGAVHCGDLPDADCAGARAAGVRGVLLDRDGSHPPGPCPRVRDLTELVERIKSCNRCG